MAIRVRIYGKVQGVWYRGWTSDQATRLGLSGWVRNRRDGSVEALFDGADEIVDEMIARCHEGPPAAVVDRVEVTGADPDVEAGFRQLPTL